MFRYWNITTVYITPYLIIPPHNKPHLFNTVLLTTYILLLLQHNTLNTSIIELTYLTYLDPIRPTILHIT